MMGENTRAAVMGAFIADALALGVHWIYDTLQIEKEFGRVDTFLRPAPDSYHPTKDKGDFTHYGDQTFLLLESLAAQKAFDLNDYSNRWRYLFKDYHGYLDQATKATLAGYSLGKGPREAGSASSDLSGASRIAPLLYLYHNDLPALVGCAKEQTMMSHHHPLVIESAEFFARVSWLVLGGMPPAGAMQAVSTESFPRSPLFQWVEKGIASKGSESVPVIKAFGQSCHTQEAFPGVVHLIARYEDNLREALVQSVMAGGDSAARGMIVGMILGARLGMESLPVNWLTELKKREMIYQLLDSLD